MKNILAFAFLTFFAGASLAQNQIEHQISQPPQDAVQGWFQQFAGTAATAQLLLPIYFLNKDTGWAGVIQTTDGGNHWLPMSGVNVDRFLDKDFGYGAGKAPGWIAITTNGGIDWINYNTGFDVSGRTLFSTHNLGFRYISHLLARTIDGGKTWKLDTIYVGTINQFASYDSLRTVAVGNDYYPPGGGLDPNAGLFLTTNGGASWRYPCRQYFDLGHSGFTGVAFLDSTTIIVTATTNSIFKSTNLGYSFTDCYTGDTSGTLINGISAPNKNNIIIVGDKGKIFRSTDAGATWIKQKSGTTKRLWKVAFVDSTTGWITGDSGMILHTMNGGYSWVNPQIKDSLHIAATPNPSNLSLTINYSLPQSQHVTINLYDMLGHTVLPILSNQFQNQGMQTIPIDVHTLPSGGYILSLQTELYNTAIHCSITH